MKVYSSARNHRKSPRLSQNVRSNLETISNMFRIQEAPALTLTPSLQSFDGEAEALTLAR